MTPFAPELGQQVQPLDGGQPAVDDHHGEGTRQSEVQPPLTVRGVGDLVALLSREAG